MEYKHEYHQQQQKQIEHRHFNKIEIIDNFLFGIASVGLDGNESVIVYPTTLISTRR